MQMNNTRYAKITFRISIIALILFIISIIFSYYRQELFGFIPGHLPHNIGFNFKVFAPINLIALTLSLIAIIRSWNRAMINGKKIRIISIGLTIPVFLFWIANIIRIAI